MNERSMVDCHETDCGTYAFEDAPSNVGLDMVHELFNLSLYPLLDLQYMAGLNVQEAECVDIV